MDQHGLFDIPLPNQPDQCLRWSLSPNQIWSLVLDKPTTIHYIRIKLYGEAIEDLHLNHEISFDVCLKNLFFLGGDKDEKQGKSSLLKHLQTPTSIKCRQITPKKSPFESSEQKYSADYLIMDYLCEMESNVRSVFDFFFAVDFEVEQLYASTIEIKFNMIKPHDHQEAEPTENSDASAVDVAIPEHLNKISVISLCEVKVYEFSLDCGSPDIPVNSIIQRDYSFLDENNRERKTYKYVCSDKNNEIKGLS